MKKYLLIEWLNKSFPNTSWEKGRYRSDFYFYQDSCSHDFEIHYDTSRKKFSFYGFDGKLENCSLKEVQKFYKKYISFRNFK